MAVHLHIPVTDDAIARFWQKVTVKGDDDCWLWTGTKTKFGYGRVTIQRRSYAATHFALSASGLPRPTGKHQALHSCDNASCVNPRHLRWGTHRDNMDDKIQRGRCTRLEPEQMPNSYRDTPENRARKEYILRSPKSCRALASELGVGATLIASIRIGKKWRGVHPRVPVEKRGKMKRAQLIEILEQGAHDNG